MPDIDHFFMRNAIAMARRGVGLTWPNPSVGAVLVDPARSNRVLARGWTAQGGRPHAEARAIEKVDGSAAGCTLYVTLEPCAHRGQTPPCTKTIISAGITRVVCAMEDPDPRVVGKGITELRDAGVHVQCGMLAEEAEDIVKGHVLRVTAGRPFVQLKIASGSDGKVPAGDGKPVWATGHHARAHGHILRARNDAILVGSGTVSGDNPELTCRLPGMTETSPVRVILSSKGAIANDTRLLKTLVVAPLWCFVAPDAPQNARQQLSAAGAEVIIVPRTDETGFIDPKSVLSELANRGITRLLIEGGPTVATSFVASGLVDEITHYRGKEPVGRDGIVPFGGKGLEGELEKGWNEKSATRFNDGDVLYVYERGQA